MNEFADLFERAAMALLQGEGPSETSDDVRTLIKTLDYDDGDTILSRHRAALLQAAAKLKRVFQLTSPDAPGLIFFGGEADPSTLAGTPANYRVGGLSGSGLSARKAFESCIGEGIERRISTSCADCGSTSTAELCLRSRTGILLPVR